MSPARARRSARRAGGRGGPRFRRLVDAWRADRQERTPMHHGTRVASIEADLGADMTPGRQARWERLDLPDLDSGDMPRRSDLANGAEPVDQGLAHGAATDDPGLAYEDQLFRAALDDVVPVEAPDRDALIERAVDLARDRFVNHGEITWPEQALDLANQQQAEPNQPAETSERETGEVERAEPADEEPEP